MQRIFVGDVQGCAAELRELLERAEAECGEVDAWFVGDLVNRGPDNLGVLRCVRERIDAGRGRCVLGNHDLHLIRTALGLAPHAPDDTFGDVLGAADADAWVDWLRSLPLIETGSLGKRDYAMVHAALRPGWDRDAMAARARRVALRVADPDRAAAKAFLSGDRSDPDLDLLERLTTCRGANADGAWTARAPLRPEAAWHRAFVAAEPDYGVVFGHWSEQGLFVAPGLRGLDTGCVHHGRSGDGFLTAWLPQAGRDDPFAVPDDAFLPVRAHRRYHPWGSVPAPA